MGSGMATGIGLVLGYVVFFATMAVYHRRRLDDVLEPKRKLKRLPLWWHLKMIIAGHHRLSRCWMGFHRWSGPGGYCIKCGICDRFFGGHLGCPRPGPCRHFTRDMGRVVEKLIEVSNKIAEEKP